MESRVRTNKNKIPESTPTRYIERSRIQLSHPLIGSSILSVSTYLVLKAFYLVN